MKAWILKILFLIFFLIRLFNLMAQPDGYEIRIKFKNLRNSPCYLGFDFGNSKYIRDTTTIDSHGVAVFKGAIMPVGGIYLIVISRTSYFEFVFTEPRVFLETDTTDFVKGMHVIESNENKAFFEYSKKLYELHQEKSDLIDEIKKHANNTDSVELLTMKISQLDTVRLLFRKSIIAKYPDYFFTKVLKAEDEPNPRAKNPGENDTLYKNYVYNFNQYHFFDHVDFSDARMLRTPIFEAKIDKYIDELTIKNTDSLKYASERVIEKSQANDEVFKFIGKKIIYAFSEMRNINVDSIIIYLDNKYYLIDHSISFSHEPTKRPNLLGTKALNISLSDTNNHIHSLYNIKQPYTVLVFWDTYCKYSKEILPKLAEWYNHHSKDSIEVYAVGVNLDREKWKSFIKQYSFKWINVWDSAHESNPFMMYDVHSVPIIYLLNKNKIIQAKRIAVNQIDELIRLLEQEKKK